VDALFPALQALRLPAREVRHLEAPEKGGLRCLAFAHTTDGKNARHDAGFVIALFQGMRVEGRTRPWQARPDGAVGQRLAVIRTRGMGNQRRI